MARMKPPRVPEKLVPVIADEDLTKLFHTCGGRDFESRRDRAIVSVFLDTGIRVSEMAGLAVAESTSMSAISSSSARDAARGVCAS